MSVPLERIKQLESVERDVTAAIQSAAQALEELGKEKPSIRQVESATNQFMKHLENVEKTIIDQLQYLALYSTGQSHEGSAYGKSKDLQMATDRVNKVKRRILEMQLMSQQRKLQAQQQTQPPS